jgi:hypothetical protein
VRVPKKSVHQGKRELRDYNLYELGGHNLHVLRLAALNPRLKLLNGNDGTAVRSPRCLEEDLA